MIKLIKSLLKSNSPSTNRVDIAEDANLNGWFKESTDELYEGFKIVEEDIVLDVGCGDQPHFIGFCANRGAEIIFADISPDNVSAMHEHLKQTAAKKLTPLISACDPVPLDDASVTKVIAMEVIEHVDDPQRFFAELVRVGKPGAQYLITVPDPVAEKVQAEGLAPDVYFQKPNHIRIIERDEFKKMVTDAGLEIEKYDAYGFYKSMWWIFFWVCNQQLGDKPEHPLLQSWEKTWEELLNTDDGIKVKRVLDKYMPKSQAIIARKPC